AAFQRPRDSSSKREQERIAALEKKLRTKDEVLAELMEEHVALKKVLGAIGGANGSHPKRAPGRPLRCAPEPSDAVGGPAGASAGWAGGGRVLATAVAL